MILNDPVKILLREIRGAIDNLKQSVTPIFDANEKSEASLLGSAVLIEVAGDVFLCTAKHVIDESISSTLYIDGPSRLEPLEGDFYSTDDHDVAVLKLSSSQTQTLHKYVPLNEDQISNQVQASNCKYVEFMGFPESKNRAAYKTTKIKGLIYSNGGIAKEITSARVHMTFDRKRNIDAATGRRVKAPDPHGMSGGAMFGVRVNDQTIRGAPCPLLVGIATDWPEKSKEVFGTNSAIVMAIIRDAWQTVLPARLAPKHIVTSPVKTRRAGSSSDA
ncbi:MAG: hypothetical protein GC152_14305 [Alphaproteobacteria bacterium]|nr:hypothetical protein [Alphaproteobacteria bacterium]